MSSVSSPVGSDHSSISGASHYDAPGDFNLERGSGPANRVPDLYKNLELEPTLRVEWLKMMNDINSPFSKNHMVCVVKFQNPPFDANLGKPVYAARVSMELSPTNFCALTNSSWVPGQDYYPGEFSIKLLTYATTTHRVVMQRTFALLPGTTIATINDFVYSRNMHKFVFLPYYVGKWKGCGDFTLQLWGELVRNQLVRPRSQEAPDSELCLDMMTTVLPNATEVLFPIGRGFWIEWDPEDDRFTPGHVYDDCKPDAPSSDV